MEQADLLRLTASALDRLGVQYALVGSFASGIWGESRFTQDIDVLVALQASQVTALRDVFSAPEFYLSLDAAKVAVAEQGQFNVIHPASGNKIDFFIAGKSDWKASQLERRRRVQLLPDQAVDVAAPEDVILGKLVYYNEGGSEKHIRDITSILAVSNELVDRPYISNFAERLGVAEIWQAIVSRLDSQRAN